MKIQGSRDNQILKNPSQAYKYSYYKYPIISKNKNLPRAMVIPVALATLKIWIVTKKKENMLSVE